MFYNITSNSNILENCSGILPVGFDNKDVIYKAERAGDCLFSY